MNKQHKAKRPDRHIYTRTACPTAPPAGQAEPQERDYNTRAFQIRPDTVDEENRTVDAVIATEAPVRVYDYQRWEMVHEILLMDGCQIPEARQIPLLDVHNRYTVEAQLGSTRSIRKEKRLLIGTNHYGRTPAADAAWSLTVDGHLTDNSVGYRVHAHVMIEPGKTEKINGRNYTAKDLPLKVCTRWSPHENSVCPIGADEDAKNRAAQQSQRPPAPRQAQPNNGKDRTMKMNWKQWLAARGLTDEALTDETRAVLEADFDAEQKRSAEPPPPATATATQDPPATREIDEELLGRVVNGILDTRATAVVEQRRSSIAELCSLAGVEDATRDEWIEDPTITITAARELATNHMRGGRPGVPQVPAVYVHPAASDANSRTLEAALLIRGNLGDAIAVDDQYRQYTQEIIDNGERLRGMSMDDLVNHSLRLANVEVPLGRDDAFRAAISTGSFSEITSNVAGVAALQGALSVAQTWRAWCSTGEVRNFQANKLVRLDNAGNLSPVGADGKLQHISLEDTGESITADTRGNILVITRKVIRDDRIGILIRAPMELGKGAIQDISHVVYTLLLANGNMADGAAIFVDATRGNLKTSCTLGPAGIQTAAAALAAQNNARGLPRDLIPAVLLVPPAQWSDAWSSTQQPVVMASGHASTSAFTYAPAVHAYGDGSIKPVMESRLSNAAYTNYSPTSWYLMAAPSQCDNIQVAFLDNVQTPTVRQVPAGVGVLGTAIEVYLDYGVAAADGQGMILCQE